MRCSNCQHDNPEEAKFCGQCGSKLGLKCLSCGRENPPANKFCFECGGKLDNGVNKADAFILDQPLNYIPENLARKILGGRAGLEGERKQVTALFADLHGFTELSEKLDPEDVRSIMNRCFEIIIEEVHRYEGTINQFLGDGVLALFGAPIALEDHPHRALSAALAIQKAIKGYGDKLKEERSIDFRMRIGLNTGLVVVGTIGNDLRMDYTAIGDTVNLASRLQSLAEPGKILISESTYRLVSGYFLTRPLGEVQVKGKSEPVRAYEVIGARSARTRIDIGIERGLTPFTGREKELSILEQCLNKVKNGHGQIVSVVGEAGVGKSRLLLEFRKSLANDNVSWLEGRCLSFGKSVSYLPVIEILKKAFHIAETDAEDDIIRKIDEATLSLGNDLEPAIPYFRYLLSVDRGQSSVAVMDAQLRRAEIFEAVRKVIVATGKVCPLVLVVEDLHWIDKTSEDFFAFLTDSLGTLPVLLILTYRPDYFQPFRETDYHRKILLNNLSGDESAKMAEALLETHSLPNDIIELINKKGEGNPFFIEELTKSLLETGIIVKTNGGYKVNRLVSPLEIPSTVQDVIMARIDRLDENRKRILQIGSVVGREFSLDLLETVSGDKDLKDHLLALRNSELIYETGFSPNSEYAFQHALTHDVAYSSLLVQKRKELHERVGTAIEELYLDRIEELYEILAHHFSRTDNREKAFHYLNMAGRKAKEVYANNEAISFYGEALKRLSGMPENGLNRQRKIDVLLDMENIYDATEKREEQKKILDELVELSMSLNDERRLSDVYIRQAEFLSVMKEYRKAKEIGKKALNLKKMIGDKSGEGKALRGMGFIHWHSGDYDKALKCHLESLNIHRELKATEAEGFELVSLGDIYRKLGRYKDALSCLEEALKIYRDLGIIFGQHTCTFNIGSVYRDMGDYQSCLKTYQECWRIIKERRYSTLSFSGVIAVPSAIANVYWRLGNYEESLKYYLEALGISRGLGNRLEEASILSSIAAIHEILGDYKESLKHYQYALEIFKELEDKASVGRVLSLIGNIFRQNLLDYHEALSYYQESLDIKKKIGDEEEVRTVLNSLGVVCWNLGLYQEALSYYQESLEVCRRTGKTIQEGIALSGMGVVYLSLHDYERALGCNQKALDILKAAGDQRVEGYILNSIGNVYYEMGDYRGAWKSYQESLRIRKELGDKRGEAWVLHNLGRVYRALENYEEAKRCYEETLSLAQEVGEEELTASSKNALSEIMKESI
ncbi:MAG TPA: tetratricopeptide repeat protein [Thermodesulfobacteriota bacterium]|nr:tetratricopeptide repeat protein [Thermodesulfobacteriota bacterium]